MKKYLSSPITIDIIRSVTVGQTGIVIQDQTYFRTQGSLSHSMNYDQVLYPDGKSCINGNIFLMGADLLFKKMDKRTALLSKTKKSDSTNTSRLSSANLRKRLDENSLGANEEPKITWSTKEVLLEIWDAETVDQDIISIYVNGKALLKEYQVQKAKKLITIPFEEETCAIKIVAVSEGKTPPNTTHIMLIDGVTATPVVANLKIGEEAEILLSRAK